MIILICLFLIINNLPVFCVNSGTCEHDNKFIYSHRSPDYNNTTNDFSPSIEADLRYINWTYPNDGSAKVFVRSNVTDMDNNISEGASIYRVTVESIDLGLPSTDLFYNFSESVSTGIYNISDQGGFWDRLIKIPAKPPGIYNIMITATDNGTIPTSKSNSINISIRLYQINRNPRVRTALEGGRFTYGTDEDGDSIYFFVNETVFIDDDVEGQPFPFTPTDDLTFDLWDPFFDMWDTVVFYENFTCGYNIVEENMFLIFLEDDLHTLPTGEKVLLRATDDYGRSVTQNITVIINGVNDDPVLRRIETYNSNATISRDGRTIITSQDKFVELTINASDIDNMTYGTPDILVYDVVYGTFNTSDTALTELPFEVDADTGYFNFTPTNDAVGEFVVNLSVSDGRATKEENFTFIIENVNDPPFIEGIRMDDLVLPIIDKSVILRFTQNQEANVVITVNDPDIFRGLGGDLTFNVNPSNIIEITKTSNTSANFTFKPTNEEIGMYLVNLSVNDGNFSDYILLKMNVLNANDPPTIVGVQRGVSFWKVNDHTFDMSYPPLTKDAPNITLILEAIDKDFETPIGENLEWDLEDIWRDGVKISISPDYYEISTSKENRSAHVKIICNKLAAISNGFYEFNFTVKDDGGLSDFIIIKINISILKTYQPITPPKIILITTNPMVEVGDILTINGTIEDFGLSRDGLKVIVKVTNGLIELVQETELNITDGKFNYNFMVPKDINGYPAGGRWSIIVWVTDGNLSSESEITTLTITDPNLPLNENDKKEESVFGMGPMMDLVISITAFLIILILSALIIFLFVISEKTKEKIMKIRKKTYRREKEQEQKTEESAPKIVTKVKCQSCGAIIPWNARKCSECGTPGWQYT